jgi:hypothetical protein
MTEKDESRCPHCGYTEKDKRIHGDHHLCTGEQRQTGDRRKGYKAVVRAARRGSERRWLTADCCDFICDECPHVEHSAGLPRNAWEPPCATCFVQPSAFEVDR